jgi:hypothetical protein
VVQIPSVGGSANINLPSSAVGSFMKNVYLEEILKRRIGDYDRAVSVQIGDTGLE